MKKFYYLKTCDTCRRIMKELELSDDIVLREIKTEPPTRDEIDELARKTGSYESLFNTSARKFRSAGLNGRQLMEADYRNLLLEDYTFLKRPVLETSEKAIAGNSPSAVEAMHRLS